MRILILLICFSYNSTAQSGLKNYKLSVKLSTGYSSHSNKPVEFPIGFTEASRNPQNQETNQGYDLSICVLKHMSNRFLIGGEVYGSKFGFNERGDELRFWTNEIIQYSINREFTIIGFGPKLGFELLNNKTNKISIYSGASYESTVSTKDVYLWRTDLNKSKFSVNSSVAYSHRLADKFHLLLGLYTRININHFFEGIEYRPYRYGITAGIEYDIVNIKRREANSR